MAGSCKRNRNDLPEAQRRKSNEPLFISGKASPTMRHFLHQELSLTTRLGGRPQSNIPTFMFSKRINRMETPCTRKPCKTRTSQTGQSKTIKHKDRIFVNTTRIETCREMSKKIPLSQKLMTEDRIVGVLLDKLSSSQTQRIKSALGRLESHKDMKIHGKHHGSVTSSKGGNQKEKSQTLPKRPTSSVTTKQESVDYCKKWQSKHKSDSKSRNSFLKENKPKKKVTFLHENHPSQHPVVDSIEKAVHIIKDKSEPKKLGGNEVKFCDGGVNVSSGCFLTETEDSPRSSKETAVDLSNGNLTRSKKVLAWENNNKEHHADECDSKSDGHIKTNTMNLVFDDKQIFDDAVVSAENSFPFKLDTKSQSDFSLEISEIPQIVNTHLGRPMPQSLGPLINFMGKLEDSEKLEHLTGICPENCLIFIPDIDYYDFETIIEVPSIQHVDDDLPYLEIVTSPESSVPKKYRHPFKPTSPPKNRCKQSHGCKPISTNDNSTEDKKTSEPQRTIEAVRKEISELENLIKGVVCAESECIMVKYQSDINRLKSTAKTTLNGTTHEKPPSPENKDTFGLRKFYKDHDVKVERIRKQHAKCLEELAKLENEAGLSHNQRQFSR